MTAMKKIGGWWSIKHGAILEDIMLTPLGQIHPLLNSELLHHYNADLIFQQLMRADETNECVLLVAVAQALHP